MTAGRALPPPEPVRRRYAAGVTNRLHALCAGALILSFAAPGQQDRRDRLIRRDGKEVTGRLLTPHAADELLVVQGGKRTRVPRSEIAQFTLVADAAREFCQRRIALQNQPRGQWLLVEWAEAHGLPGLARAQALLLVLDDDRHEAAHEFLGHRRSPKGWLWELRGKRLLREQYEAALLDKPLELVGERFAVVADAGLRANVAALLDLEHLAVVFHEQLGVLLGAQESLTPIRVVCSRNDQVFPRWGFRPVPYYVPAPHGDEARTFYAGANPTRPEKLFFVGAHALLYRTLIGDLRMEDDRERVCPWLEIGLSSWFQNLMQGPAGFAAPGSSPTLDLQALTALARQQRLTQLLHQSMYTGYYLGDELQRTLHWSAATMFATFLLDPTNVPRTREPFLEFVRQALVERKGDSSTAFDKAMGRRAEEFEEPFTRWLGKQATSK